MSDPARRLDRTFAVLADYEDLPYDEAVQATLADIATSKAERDYFEDRIGWKCGSHTIEEA